MKMQDYTLLCCSLAAERDFASVVANEVTHKRTGEIILYWAPGKLRATVSGRWVAVPALRMCFSVPFPPPSSAFTCSECLCLLLWFWNLLVLSSRCMAKG